MKIDMHCHTKEGSLDGKVPIEDYIEKLKSEGFGGMLVTDHNSYHGYRHWKKYIKGKRHTDFLVLKGIEYDTFGAGHMLVIMPETIKLRILELRGLPAHLLISIVHACGGIIGPAHPCGEKYLSITNTKSYYKDPRIIRRFDFIEAFNACESEESNASAAKLAEKYGKPCFGGSDAHKIECVGKAYTEVPDGVKSESDLIACVMKDTPFEVGGSYYNKTTKEKMGKANKVLVYSFWVYNKVAGLSKAHKRNEKLKSEYSEKEL